MTDDVHFMPLTELGLQLVAAHWAEATLIDTSIAFQNATDWHTRHPPC